MRLLGLRNEISPGSRLWIALCKSSLSPSDLTRILRTLFDVLTSAALCAGNRNQAFTRAGRGCADTTAPIARQIVALQALATALAILVATPAQSQIYSPWGEAPFWERPSAKSEPNRENQRPAKPRDRTEEDRSQRPNAAADQDAQQDEFIEPRPAGTPMMAIVSLKQQRVTIYDANGPILNAPISSGRTGYETPVGIYSVLQKEAEHYSNRYDDASMPFMQRITWSGIALHAGALPGYPASHGCIRMPYGFAERLFGVTSLGMRVIVVRDDVAPTSISHPLLFQQKPTQSIVALYRETRERSASGTDDTDRMRLGVTSPSPDGGAVAGSIQLALLKRIAEAKSAEAQTAQKKADDAKLEAARKAAEASRPAKALGAAKNTKEDAEARLKNAEQELQAATSPTAIQRAENTRAKAAAKLTEAVGKLEVTQREVQPKIDEAARAAEAAQAADAAKIAASEAARKAKRKLWPVSVFISLKTQRLYVRQALEPVFESPVTVRDPDKPVDTHIFTALNYADGVGNVRWSVVSLSGKPSRPDGERHRSDGQRAEQAASELSAATAALDRVTIPQDAIDRISEVVLPGSSLIISDEDISKETGQATDFIVLKSGEPQGGLKNRPRNPGPSYRYERRYRASPYGGPFFGWW
jgi:lipoprotein-anchoring transpeptidase ErfK/SrfK